MPDEAVRVLATGSTKREAMVRLIGLLYLEDPEGQRAALVEHFGEDGARSILREAGVA